MRRHALAAVAALLALPACLDQLLESPYLLAPGLGEVRSLSPGIDGRLLAATPTGLYAIDPGGKAERYGPATPADAVSCFPRSVYVLHDGRISLDGVDALPAPGAVDLLAGYDELVVLYPDRLERLPLAWLAATHAPGGAPVDPAGLSAALVRTVAVAGGRSVALGPAGTYLVVTATDVLRVGPDDTVTPLATGLPDARAAALDPTDRIYVAAGGDLWRLDPAPGPNPWPGTAVSVARWLDDARDLHFGVGPFPRENLYIANGAGTVDYLRPP